MEYQKLKQVIDGYSGKELEQRKNWYSPAADAYAQARPTYPEPLIVQVMTIAQLSSQSKVLEVGCGPATATTAFARSGCSILALEPNLDFCRLAQQKCASFPNVEIQNTSFEEWNLQAVTFDAVVAASSFHWIPSDAGYPKAASALKQNGSLILLWNKELQPSYEAYQRLSEVYQQYAPNLDRYEDRATQIKILQGLGQFIVDSGCFGNVVSDYVETQITYTVDQYLTLLTTYSPYLKLDSHNRESLFAGLREAIEEEFGGILQLSYLSAFHIARPA